MPNSHRFPKADSEFNDYVQSAVPYLIANWARLVPSAAAPPAPLSPSPSPSLPGGTDPRLTQLQTYYATWNITYPRSKDANTRTQTITNDKDTLRTQIEALLRSVFSDIPQSFLTTADRTTLNLRARDTTPTHHHTPITDIPVLSMKPLGQGDFTFHVSRTHDATRDSKYPGAEIEVRYQVLALDARPTHIDDMTNSFISTKAIFVFHAGTQNTGKILWAAVRWIIISDPSLNSPWSGIQNMGIA